MALLAVEDLHTYYGEAHILQGVSLHLEDGEVVTLIGRNGAGKTTTLRSIMGIARPSRGRVTLRGEDIGALATHEVARRGIAGVPAAARRGGGGGGAGGGGGRGGAPARSGGGGGRGGGARPAPPGAGRGPPSTR